MSSPFLTLPNLITLFRILLVPIIVVLLISPFKVSSLVTVIVFLVAAGSDWLDGRIARRYNQVSALGALLDPIADKLLIMAALISLVSLGRVPAWIVVSLVGRDLVVSGIRQMGAVRGDVIPPSKAGKYKTAMEMISVVLVMVSIDYACVDPVLLLGLRTSVFILLVALVLAVISAASYLSHLLTRMGPETSRD